MDVSQAIKYANSILPGVPALEGEEDLRWQAIIKVGDFIHSNPEEVWSFITRWGIHQDEDLRSAIATCLLEHLLEHHFEKIFPRVQFLANKSELFSETFLLCHKFGATLEENNSLQFDKLKNKIEKKLFYSR